MVICLFEREGKLDFIIGFYLVGFDDNFLGSVLENSMVVSLVGCY